MYNKQNLRTVVQLLRKFMTIRANELISKSSRSLDSGRKK